MLGMWRAYFDKSERAGHLSRLWGSAPGESQGQPGRCRRQGRRHRQEKEAATEGCPARTQLCPVRRHRRWNGCSGSDRGRGCPQHGCTPPAGCRQQQTERTRRTGRGSRRSRPAARAVCRAGLDCEGRPAESACPSEGRSVISHFRRSTVLVWPKPIRRGPGADQSRCGKAAGHLRLRHSDRRADCNREGNPSRPVGRRPEHKPLRCLWPGRQNAGRPHVDQIGHWATGLHND